MTIDVEAERDNSSRVYLRRVIAEFATELPLGARVLDAGAGPARYAPLFADQHYETADRRPGSTYVCDLHSLPIPDETFDAALSTQVLGLMQEPKTVLSELYRVLKKGGPILVSAPMLFPEEPRDYCRFTSLGLHHLFEAAGFQVTQVTWLEGFFGSLGWLLRAASEQLGLLERQPYSSIDRKIVQQAEGDLALLGQAFNELDLRHKETSAGFPLNHVIRAYKL